MRGPEETQKKISKKPFGIEAHVSTRHGVTRWWYTTEKKRDRALTEMQKDCDTIHVSAFFRKVER